MQDQMTKERVELENTLRDLQANLDQTKQVKQSTLIFICDFKIDRYHCCAAHCFQCKCRYFYLHKVCQVM